MEFIWFICSVILFGSSCGILDRASGHVYDHRRQLRSAPSSSPDTNDTISAFLTNAVPVYCHNAEPMFAMAPTAAGAAGNGARPSTYMAGMFATPVPPKTVVRMVTLNDSQMHDMFQHKGGNYLQDYMATTQIEAKRNFPNLLLMTAPIKVAGSNVTLTLYDNFLAQQTILDDLQKLHIYMSTVVKSATKVAHSTTEGVNTTINSHGSKSSQAALRTYPTLLAASSKTNPDKSISSDPTKDYNSIKPPTSFDVRNLTPRMNTGLNTLLNTTTASDQSKSSTTKSRVNADMVNTFKTPVNTIKDPLADLESKEKTMQPTSESEFSTSRSSDTSKPTTFSMPLPFTTESVVSKSLPALDNYLHGKSEFNSNEGGYLDLNSIWRESNTTIHPGALLELERVRRRRRRQADGSVSMEQYCQMKGSRTDDGYLHMCSTCAVITKLPDHYFPRFVNEAVCKTGDSNCFVINGIPHGQCRQRTITLNIMRKKPNKCLLMVHNGENIMTDDWELYPKTIRVSCECLIKKNSFLAPYVKGGIPQN